MTDFAAPCPGCGGLFEPADGATHPYMLASPGCWTTYGVLLAREYQSPKLFAAAHRLTVDAYALQHPGDPGDRRARQSVWLHYASLEAVFDRGLTLAQATSLLKGLVGQAVPPFTGRPSSWGVTLADIAAVPVEGHAAQVRRWAEAAFVGWRPILRP